MKSRLSIGFPIALLVALAALTYWLSHTVQAPLQKRDGSGRHDPDYIIEKFTATRLGPDGKPATLLTAEKMIHFPDDDSTQLVEPKFTRLSPHQKAALHISARQGLLSSDGKNIYFKDHVEATRDAYTDQGKSHSALSLSTDFLHIQPGADKVDTDRAVTIRDANSVVSAIGLQLDNKTRIIKLLSHVKGRYEKH
ncbi:MAG: LPS export ABC transporter periplasmic protein LptC [Sulfuricellaceae bacterium]|nr:LPS export ABC transporter periplasmic protein LptC [Sulfuricellaceae bacterium]